MATKTALILGASGFIGQRLTQQLLAAEEYSAVNILVRQKMDLEHPKLNQLWYDYDHPNAAILSADDVYCCLGTTIKTAGSPEAFRKVDYQYVVETAALAHQQGANSLAVVSSMGADANSKLLYSRVKGEMENALQAQGWEKLYIARPSLLLGDRDEFRLGESLGKIAAKAVGFLIPAKYKGITGQQVAKALHFYIKEGATGQHIVESDVLRKV